MLSQLKSRESQGLSTWTDPLACSALCHLLLDDRSSCPSRRGAPTSKPHLELVEDDKENEPNQLPHKRRSRHKSVSDTLSSPALDIMRPRLPSALYVEHVASYLRFGGPMPNMLYVFGGRVPLAGFQTLRPSAGVVHDSVEMFDTWHGRWVQCPPMPCHRAGAAAACLPDGRILVCGGYDQRGVVEGLLSTCDAYSPWEERWEADVAQLSRGRWGHSCVTLGNSIYAVGGCSTWQPGEGARNAFMETLRSCEVLTDGPGEKKWQPCGSLQVARSGARVVALGEKYLVAVGGCEDPFGRVKMQTSLELYDVRTGCWSLLDVHLTNPRTCAVVAAFNGNRVVVGGGASVEQPPGGIDASMEVVTVPLPRGKQLAAIGEGEGDDEKASGVDKCEASLVERMSGTPDFLVGRVGCQATVVDLPSHSSRYPFSNQRCLVAIGGERSDRKADSESFSRVLNLETGAWCDSDLIPQLKAPSRTAVALCVGVGRVDGARLRE